MEESGKKRILIFAMMYHPWVGGAEVALKEITDRVDQDAFEFHMVTIGSDPNVPKVERVGNVLVHRIGLFKKRGHTINDFYHAPLKFNKWLFQFAAAIKAVRLHRRYHYDGIWAMLANGASVPSVLFHLMHADVTYIMTLQEGHDAKTIKRRMLPVYPLFALSFKRVDVIQVISHYLGDFARNMGFRGPLEIIPNAVDVQHFTRTYTEEEIAKTRKALGTRDDDTFLVTTSRLVHKNGIDDVIRALPRLSERVQFIVFGTGPDEKALKELADRCGVAERVHFKGAISHQEMPRYLHACDIFIRPSRSEGMGNSFIEAMAAGLPVVATQVGGIADFLFDPKRNPDKNPTGFAVDPNDPEGIAVRVQGIMDGRTPTQEVVANAQALVRERYDWDTITEQMKNRVFSHF